MSKLKRMAVGLSVLLVVKLVHVAIARSTDDSLDRLVYLGSRIDSGATGLAPSTPPFDGEWRNETILMTVLASANLAFRHPAHVSERRAEIHRWVQLLGDAAHRQFETDQWQSDAFDTLESSEGHAGYLGQLALAMGAECMVGHDADPRYAGIVKALARRIDASPTALIQTYPGETYVPDNVVAMAGISLFDRCTGSLEHRPTIERWVATMKATRVDRTTGVLVFAPEQGARGSGAAWNALYLPFIDEAFAQEQHQRLIDVFEVSWLGCRSTREWPPGVDGEGDIDSGPLLLGVSMSATGFAMSALAWRDRPELEGYLLTAELFGTTFNGSYLAAPLVGDAIVLAARTATPWVKPLESRTSL